MSQRLNYFEQASKLLDKLVALGTAIHSTSLTKTMIDLINIRASQLNACTFCVDMHSKEAKIHGERELRLYHISVWRESSLFCAKERALLEWTEQLTQLRPEGISDQVYDLVRTQLSEQEIVEATVAVGTINIWNRMNAAFRGQHGSMDKVFGLDKAGLE